MFSVLVHYGSQPFNKFYKTYLHNLILYFSVQHVPSQDGGTYHVNLCDDAGDDCPDGVQVCYTDKSLPELLVLGDHDKATITIDCKYYI